VRAVEGGDPLQVGAGLDVFPLAWSPDGSKLLYTQGNSYYVTIGNIAVSSLWVAPSVGGDSVQLTDGSHIDHSPVWAPDGRHILFVSDRGGGCDIYQMAIENGSPVRLTTGLHVHTLSRATDGARLAYSLLTSRSNLWSIPIREDEAVSVHEATPVTAGNQIIETSAVSPDGKWLAFDSNRSGNSEIYKMPIEGGELQQLTNHPAPDFLPAWSPDGTQIVFQSQRTGNRDLFVMSADGGPARQLTIDPGYDSDPEWAVDGNLYFNSDRTGRFEIFYLETHEGELRAENVRQLTFVGGLTPIPSPDARLVAFTNPDGLCFIAIDGSGTRSVLSGSISCQPHFSRDGSTIFCSDSFYGGGSANEGFWAVPVSGGQPKRLVHFDDPSRARMYPRFGSDGERLFFSLTEFESDLWLMELEPGDGS